MRLECVYLEARSINFVEGCYYKEIIDEVVVRDCYKVTDMSPLPAFVVDGGACFGDFSLFCWKLGVPRVVAYEADPDAFAMMQRNIAANPGSETVIEAHNAALAFPAPYPRRMFKDRPSHCWLDQAGNFPVDKTAQLPVGGRHSFLKLDVEGAERELFHPDNRDVLWSWDRIAMEWHNQDGAVYALALELLGFKVSLTGGDGAPWGPGMSGGLIHARKR